jgi:hypothetical protein
VTFSSIGSKLDSRMTLLVGRTRAGHQARGTVIITRGARAAQMRGLVFGKIGVSFEFSLLLQHRHAFRPSNRNRNFGMTVVDLLPIVCGDFYFILIMRM